jgi:hypothetical protein
MVVPTEARSARNAYTPRELLATRDEALLEWLRQLAEEERETPADLDVAAFLGSSRAATGHVALSRLAQAGKIRMEHPAPLMHAIVLVESGKRLRPRHRRERRSKHIPGAKPISLCIARRFVSELA